MVDEAKTAKTIDDTQTLGWYTAYLCLLAEILFLTQLGNVNYMVYAGLSPPKAYCEMSNSTRQAAELLQKYPHGRTGDNSSVTELPAPQFQSANIEFHTLCEETKYIKRSISYQMFGIIIGSVVFGQLSDSFGRKWTMVFCLIGTSITDFISSFANGVMTLTLYRGVALFFTGGQAAILLVFMVENLPKRDRMWINTVISWSPNFALFAVMAWTCGEWRILARALGTLAIPGTILCLFISESPRWLVQKERKEEAFDAIKRIIRFNGGPKMSDDEITRLIDNESAAASKSAGTENFYMYHLFCTAKLTTYTLVFAFSYIATSVLNYGIFFNMSELPGSIFVNNIVIGCVRWVLNSMMGAVDFRVKSFGRKMLHAMSMGIILLAAFLVFWLVQLGKDQEYEKIMRPAVLSVAIMCSFLYVDNNISCNELFPTPIRNSAFSFMQVINRTGVAIAPQLFLLAGFWRSAPYAVMMALCIVDMILYQSFIPETKGRKLENSMPTPQERFFSSKSKDGTILPYEKTPPKTDHESAL